MRGYAIALAFLVAAQAPSVARGASGPSSYVVGTLPFAPGLLGFEFPLRGGLGGELTFQYGTQGTYRDANPFAYLSILSPAAAVNLDYVRNVRFTVGYQELWYRAVPPLGIAGTREERLFARARVQQPRGGVSALYETVQLTLRSFSDPAGNHHYVFRPSLRFGEGLNLDARRVHSVSFFQEVALRFSDASYTTHAFDSYRAFLGYTWTTRRGWFASFGFIGQLSVDPAATQLTFSYGPLLSLTYRIFPAAAEAPEVPPEPISIDLQ